MSGGGAVRDAKQTMPRLQRTGTWNKSRIREAVSLGRIAFKLAGDNLCGSFLTSTSPTINIKVRKECHKLPRSFGGEDQVNHGMFQSLNLSAW